MATAISTWCVRGRAGCFWQRTSRPFDRLRVVPSEVEGRKAPERGQPAGRLATVGHTDGSIRPDFTVIYSQTRSDRDPMTKTLTTDAIAPNAQRLLWAGFLAILAAGIGFGIRGGILANWAADFGFTGAQLGAIGGAGFTGFCFGIIIGGVVVDRVGYGKLVVAAFLFHVLSAFITFAATQGQAQSTAYLFLYLGTFVFALANGTLEAVANPLVSTLFPNNRTHYLNILHASWPAGLVVGGLIGWTLGAGGV